MTRFLTTRRTFLAASAALFAAGTARASDADVIVIGAGAAGIGAARELKRLGKSFILIEARDMNEAIGIAAKIPVGQFGCIEVRPIMTIPQ